MFGLGKLVGKFLTILGFKPHRVAQLRCIIKFSDGIEDWYMLWSMNSACPLSRGMSKMDFTDWYLDKFPNTDEFVLEDRLDDADIHGSDHPEKLSFEAVIKRNKAGKGGTTLTKQGLLLYYCAPTRYGRHNHGKGYLLLTERKEK